MFKIDKNKCTGCGVCVNICPEGFEVVDGKSEIKDQSAACINKAASSCPQSAIISSDSEKTKQVGQESNLGTYPDRSITRWFGRRGGMGRRRGRRW